VEDYRAKRNPAQTPEPEFGSVRAPDRGPLRFAIQLHRATNLHFDLRLEVGGVLKSWAVPKGFTNDPAVKAFAAPTEDHPYAYATFEGVIPAGQYGAGEMMVWDLGIWFCDEDAPVPTDWGDPAQRKAHEEAILANLERGKLSCFLCGERIKGSYALIQTKEGWLIIKHKDRWMVPVPEGQSSVLTGRNFEQLARSGKGEVLSLAEPKPGKFPESLLPMKAEMGDLPFDSPAWIFEPKLDGIRALIHCQGERVVIRTRKGNDQTFPFPDIARAFRELNVHAVFDGEIVAFENGQPSFSAMMKRFHLKDEAAIARLENIVVCQFFAFDLLWFDGLDLKTLTTLERKRWLRRALMPHALIKYVDHLPEQGNTFYQAVVAAGFEGAMAKRAEARYEATGKPSLHWLKLKYTSSHEFVIGGWSEGEGSRQKTFGAVYVGYFQDRKFVYAGRVGSGFNEDELERVNALLRPLAQKKNPFDTPVEIEGPTTWMKPELVVEVKFAEMMPSGHLRSPVYLRLRPEVEASEVGPPRLDRTAPEITVKPPPKTIPKQDELAKQLDQTGKYVKLTLEGREFTVSNLDKVLWPETTDRPAQTKRDLLKYLASVGPHILRHLKDRPLTLIRFPDGIHGEKFFQKHIDQGRPEWIRTVTVWSDTQRKEQEYLLVDELSTLLWLGHLGTLEFHVPSAKIRPDQTYGESEANVLKSSLNYPDSIRFDLDPQIYAGTEKPGEEPELNREAFERTKTAAFWLRDLLRPMGIDPAVKTSGKTGLHIFIPVAGNLDTTSCRLLSTQICQNLERQHPRELTTAFAIQQRVGKVFLDYNMNGLGRTLPVAYSPRASFAQAVSMPLTWEELEHAYAADFTFERAIQLLKQRGDLWADLKPYDLLKLFG
jgi:bifunctional non-homologous end joining protein LigD